MTRLQSTLHRIHLLDVHWCIQFNAASRHRLILIFFQLISRLGNGVFWYALMIGLLLHDSAHEYALVLKMLITGAITTCIYKILKHKTLRPRPYQVHQHIAVGAPALDQFSFPSGHTLHAVMFSILACTAHPELILSLGTFSVLVAISRLVLGLHYPSDVLAAIGLGSLIGCLAITIVP